MDQAKEKWSSLDDTAKYIGVTKETSFWRVTA